MINCKNVSRIIVKNNLCFLILCRKEMNANRVPIAPPSRLIRIITFSGILHLRFIAKSLSKLVVQNARILINSKYINIDYNFCINSCFSVPSHSIPIPILCQFVFS